MKTLALILFLVGGPVAMADDGDLLQNTDFAAGIAHWEGDCHSIGSTSDDSGATSGIVVSLRSGEWTKVGQDFDAKAGDYLLKITYLAPSDLSFSQRPDDYINVPAKLDLMGLGAYNSSANLWCIMVVDAGESHYTYWQVTPNLSGTGTQTLTTNVELKSGDEFKKGFYLAFPPGHGYINLLSISLIPKDATVTTAQ